MSTRLAIVAALLLAGAALLARASSLDDAAVWSEWKAKHNKVYQTPEEEARRHTVFLDNKKVIELHNAKFAEGKSSYSMGLNAFSDLTSEEFRKIYASGLRLHH